MAGTQFWIFNGNHFIAKTLCKSESWLHIISAGCLVLCPSKQALPRQYRPTVKLENALKSVPTKVHQRPRKKPVVALCGLRDVGCRRFVFALRLKTLSTFHLFNLKNRANTIVVASVVDKWKPCTQQKFSSCLIWTPLCCFLHLSPALLKMPRRKPSHVVSLFAGCVVFQRFVNILCFSHGGKVDASVKIFVSGCSNVWATKMVSDPKQINS